MIRVSLILVPIQAVHPGLRISILPASLIQIQKFFLKLKNIVLHIQQDSRIEISKTA
jgi:hypothetical protein